VRLPLHVLARVAFWGVVALLLLLLAERIYQAPQRGPYQVEEKHGGWG
jgi:hypothetical protein